MFFKLILSILLVANFSSCGPKDQADSTLNQNALRWGFQSSGNLRFSSTNQDLIKRGMNVLSRRVDSSSVWQCAKANHRRWKVNNSGQDITTVERHRSFVRLHEAAFRSGTIPSITFTPYNENSNSMGRAFVGGFVKAKFVETTSLVPMYNFDGQFKVQINLSNLNSSEWSDPDVWAGVVFHEMLHQMGYNHDVGVYDDDMFITVMGDCVESNGRFQSRRSGFNLAGRRFPIPD